jgi:hypothetical protein
VVDAAIPRQEVGHDVSGWSPDLAVTPRVAMLPMRG